MANIYTVGSSNTVQFDLGQKTVNIMLTRTESNIESLWSQQFASYPKMLLCLSGGLDSQFSAQLVKKHCDQVHAVTFQFLWQDNIVNSDDVCMSIRLARKLGITHEIIDIDLKDFLDNHLIETAKKYLTTSPQISAHLYAIEQHLAHRDLPIMMGGEAPLITVRQGIAVMPFRWPSSLNGRVAEIEANHFRKLVLPYTVMAQQLGIKLVKDPFLMSPEIYYQAYLQNLKVFEDQSVIVSMDEPMRTETTNYKKSYYESFGFDMTAPLKKLTGFERLKVHHAVETGVYDEFDKKYREPLKALGIPTDRSLSMPQFSNDANLILKQAQAVIDSTDLTPVNVYDFDW